MFATDFGRRMEQMALDLKSHGWDGDKCVVLFLGRQPFVMGTLRHGLAGQDVDDNQWTDPASASFMEAGSRLADGTWDPTADELPVVKRDGFADHWGGRWGRTLWSRWFDQGVALEVRDTGAGRVLAQALLHVEATKRRLLARVPRLLVQLTDGTAGLAVDDDDPSTSDLDLPLTPAVRYNQALVVVNRLQDELQETRSLLTALRDQHNALVGDLKRLQGAAAGIVFVGTGVMTNTVGVAAIPTASTVVTDLTKPAPTAAEKAAMRSRLVKLAP